MPHESEITFGPLYAVLLNPGSSKAKRWAAGAGDPGATTNDVGKAKKWSTVPDAVLWVEQHQGKFPRAAPLVVPVDRGAMEAAETRAVGRQSTPVRMANGAGPLNGKATSAEKSKRRR